jgi:4-amino-4-deoxychorismate lyase
MSSPLRVLLDGVACSDSWPLDRGLHYGDGVFETLLVRNGRVRFGALHRQRFATGCDRLQLRVDQAIAWQEVETLAAQQGSAQLKLLVTRGPATERGYTPSGREQPQRLLLAYPAPAAEPAQQPAAVITLQATLGENPLLAGIKHCNRLEQVLARAQLRHSGALEGLMSSSSGRLVSGTMSNVFLVLDGELVTPKVDRCGIAGVMRRVVLREAAALGWPARETDIAASDAALCSEMFVTNIRLGLRPITQFDGRALPVGERMRQLQAHVAGLDE